MGEASSTNLDELMFVRLAFVMQELKRLEERLVVSSRHPAFMQLLVFINRVSRPEHLGFTSLFAAATMRSVLEHCIFEAFA